MNRAYLIAPIVVLALCVCGIAVTDHTDTSSQETQTWTSGDCTCTLDDNGVFTVSGQGAMDDYSSSVSSIPWYSVRNQITSIVIEDGVTTIGGSSMLNSAATSVTISDSVTSIGNSAFASCTSLASVTIPDSVTSIEGYAFSNCTSLASVTIPDSVTSIGNDAFSYCSALASVTIPDSVESIGQRAFSNCTSLASVTIPNSVTSIGEYAFQYCTSLKSILFGQTTWNITIGSNAFSLGVSSSARVSATVYSPNNMANGQLDAYKGNYTTFTYASSVMTWTSRDTTCTLDKITGVFTVSGTGEMEDYDMPDLGRPWHSVRTQIKSVVVENGVTKIGWNAFNGCTNLTSVTIQDSVRTIGISAFMECTSLASIVLPEGITTIYGNAFENCTSLTSLTIPNSVTNLVAMFAQGCTSLESITFGNGITSIPIRACSGCTALTTVTFGNSVTTIDQGAFYMCTSLASVTIPDTVTTINSNAFYHCTSLASLDLGNGLVTLGPETFRECSALTFVTIPDSVTTIGQQAFQNCTSLIEIDIGASVTSIGQQAFDNCPSVAQVVFQATEWSVTTIGSNAFGLGNADTTTTAIVYSRENIARDMLDGYTNEYTTLYYNDLPNYAVTITVNNADWGSVNLTYILVERGTQISIEDNVLHVGTFSITATPNESTAQYTYSFAGWTGIPLDERVVQDLTITANFSAEVNRYTVTFTVNDPTYGRVDLGFVEADYGSLIEVDGNIVRINDSEITATPTDPYSIYTYSFLRWDGLTERVVGDSTITAVFSMSASMPASEYIDGTTHKEYSGDGGILAIVFSIVPLLLGLMVIAGLASSMGAFKR